MKINPSLLLLISGYPVMFALGQNSTPPFSRIEPVRSAITNRPAQHTFHQPTRPVTGSAKPGFGNYYHAQGRLSHSGMSHIQDRKDRGQEREMLPFISHPDKNIHRMIPVHFPDSLKKEKKKNCCNSWCFGTSAYPLLNIVHQRSILLNHKVRFTGVRLGGEIGKKIRLGIGIYNMDTPIDLEPVPRKADTLIRRLKFEYVNLFWEYVIYEDFYWEFAVPFAIGKAFGKVDTGSSLHPEKRGIVKADSAGIFTAGFDFQYRFIPWLGIGGGVGFRQMLSPDYSIRQGLNGLFYTLKLKLFLGYLFKAVFNKKKLIEEREEYRREKAERKKVREERRNEREGNIETRRQ